MSYEQVVIKDILSKIPLKDLLEKNFPQLQPTLNFNQILKKYYQQEQESFVVKKGKEFLGILDLKKVPKLSSSAQQKTLVSQLLIPKSKIKPLDPKADCYQAFRSMLQQDLDLLPIFSKNTFQGIITRKSLMHRLVLELKYGLSLNHLVVKDKFKQRKVARKVKKKEI